MEATSARGIPWPNSGSAQRTIIEDHLLELSKDREWGGSEILNAVRDQFGFTIRVFSKEQEPLIFEGNGGETVNIFYNGIDHYDSVSEVNTIHEDTDYRMQEAYSNKMTEINEQPTNMMQLDFGSNAQLLEENINATARCSNEQLQVGVGIEAGEYRYNNETSGILLEGRESEKRKGIEKLILNQHIQESTVLADHHQHAPQYVNNPSKAKTALIKTHSMYVYMYWHGYTSCVGGGRSVGARPCHLG